MSGWDGISLVRLVLDRANLPAMASPTAEQNMSVRVSARGTL